MLRMPPFTLHHPREIPEAVALWGELPGAVYTAGGTDLLPNIKHRLLKPPHVIALGGLGRGEVVDATDGIWIDAFITLTRLQHHPLIRQYLPPLSEAAGLIGGPQIRNMGTLGGNIMLDTRCVYYNQTEAWRQALGHCLKAEGSWCHVVGGPKTCVAAQSADTVAVLHGLGAEVELVGPAGVRLVPIRALYRFNGLNHLHAQPGEILTRVRVPHPSPRFRGRYAKLRLRGAIDFPLLCVAVLGEWEGTIPTRLEIVLNAVGPAPKAISGLEDFLHHPLTTTQAEAIAGLVVHQARPQRALAGEPRWRRAMAGVLTTRLLLNLAHANG